MRLTIFAVLITTTLIGCGDYYDELAYAKAAFTFSSGPSFVLKDDERIENVNLGTASELLYTQGGFELLIRQTEVDLEDSVGNATFTSFGFGFISEKMHHPNIVGYAGLGVTYDYLDVESGGYYKPVFTVRNLVDGLYAKAGLAFLLGGWQITTSATVGRNTLRSGAASSMPNLYHQYFTIGLGASIEF